MPGRHDTAKRTGGFEGGEETPRVESGVLDGVKFDVGSRFGSAPGTNRDELLAAAHAGRYSMSRALGLVDATIVLVHLDAEAGPPDADGRSLNELADTAPDRCVKVEHDGSFRAARSDAVDSTRAAGRGLRRAPA